jgi:Zn-dependent protease
VSASSFSSLSSEVSDRPPEPPPSAPPPKQRRSAGVAVGGALLAILAKAKLLLVGLQALKFGKLLLTMGSMAVMIAFEARRGGWRFAVGFVVLILIHEIGHGVEIKRAGLSSGYPVFIPFFGALIAMRGQPRSPLVEARIAIAGPLWGGAASVGAAAVYLMTHQRLFLSIAYAGFFLNLFNLTPLGFLDGGRITRVFARRAWIIGLVIFAGLFAFTKAPQLLIIGLMALTHAWNRTPVEVDEVPVSARRQVAFGYFVLCAVLAAGVAFCSGLLAR